ncbi:MAG: hypothetical protein IKD89_06390 [Clostridia bacterium]|nr:hypothetical protein [Clostridia bacterium]
MDKKKNLEEKQEFRNLKRYADAIISHNDDDEFEAILKEFSSDRERYERTAPKKSQPKDEKPPAEPRPAREEKRSAPEPRETVREERRSAPVPKAEPKIPEKSVPFVYEKRLDKSDVYSNEIKEHKISFENAPEAVKDFVDESEAEAQDRKAKLLDMAFGPASADEFDEDASTDIVAFIEKKSKKDPSDYYAEILAESAKEKAKNAAKEKAMRAKEEAAEHKSVIDIDIDADVKTAPPLKKEPAAPPPAPAASPEDFPEGVIEENESDLVKMGLIVGVKKKAREEVPEDTANDEAEAVPESEAPAPEETPAAEEAAPEEPMAEEETAPTEEEGEALAAEETAVFEPKADAQDAQSGETPEEAPSEEAEGADEAPETEGVTDKTIRIERPAEPGRVKSDWDEDEEDEDEWEEWGEPEEDLAGELKKKFEDKIGFIKKIRPGSDAEAGGEEGEEETTDEEEVDSQQSEVNEVLETFDDPEQVNVQADEYDEVYDVLTDDSSRSWVRIIVSAIAFALLALIDIFDFAGIVPPGAMGTNGDKIYAGVAIIILAIVIIMNIDVMKNGARTLFSNGKQQGVSFVFLSSVIVSAHAVYSFIRCLMVGEAFTSYASVVALAMLLYGIGRRVYDSTHIKNFEAIYEAGSGIMEVKSVADGELTKITSKFSTLGKNFYYKNNALTTGGFLEYARGGERETSLGSRMTSIILAVSVVCFIFVAVILGQRGGFERWFGLLAAVFAMVLPSMFEFTGALVFARSTSNARKQGAVISGSVCASKYSEMEAVLLDDSDIFRRGTVLIKSLKIVDKDVITNILPDVASIFVTIDSPAKYAFMDIIDHKEEMLKPVSFYERIDGEGLLALVDGAKILLGNRDFMVSQGVIPASYPEKFFKEGKARFNMYVALDGKLVCVFSMAYLLDIHAGEALMKLEREDVKSVIATFDPNLTEHGLKNLFDITEGDSLKLMHPQDIMKFKELLSTSDQIGRSGMYLTKQSVLSFTALVGALKSIRFATHMNKVFMMAAMIGAPILLTLIAMFNGMTHISPFIIILLQLLWNIPVWINSAFAK